MCRRILSSLRVLLRGPHGSLGATPEPESVTLLAQLWVEDLRFIGPKHVLRMAAVRLHCLL